MDGAPSPVPPTPEYAIRAILEGTAGETGEQFFAALVKNTSRALGVAGAWVTEYLPAAGRLRAGVLVRGRLRRRLRVLEEIVRLGPTYSPVFDSVTRGVPVTVSAGRM